MKTPELTLPAPARDLWHKLAGVVRQEIGRISHTEPAYAIGGGSVLAARWQHRHSHDVDLVVPADTPLGRLATNNDPGSKFETAMRALGGEPRFNSDIRLWTVSFDGGERKLDLWATTPLLAAGEQKATIDGHTTVLSSAQILRGKLERSQDHLARDVFDLVKAAEKEPEALEAAVNTISNKLADEIAQTFHWAGPTIAADAATMLTGIPDEEQIDPKALGGLAAHAMSGSVYTICRIETRDGRIEVTTATSSRSETTRQIARERAEHYFEASGLNGYLRAKGPGNEALLEYARTAAARGRGTLVFEGRDDAVTAWRTAKAGMNLMPGDASDAHDDLERRVRGERQQNRDPGYKR